MIKVNLYLDKRLVNAFGESVMKIRLTHQRQTSYISTSVKVAPSMWNGKKVLNSPQLTNIINMYYDRIRGEVARLELSGQFTGLNVRQIRDRVLKEIGIAKEEINESPLLLDYYRQFALTKKAKETRRRYLFFAKHIEAYNEDVHKLHLNEIDVKWANGFADYISSKVSVNSMATYMAQLNAMFNHALDENLIATNPMRKIKIKPLPTIKRSLSVEQLQRLMRVENLTEQQEYARDYFILMFYLIGINMADLFHLTEINGGRIEYYRAKTQKPISIKVEPEAMEIINKYRGDKKLLDLCQTFKNHISCSSQFCLYLKTIKDDKGIICPTLSPYWARHTWATIASELDTPKEVIANALSHSMNSITDVYIAFNRKKIDDANRKVIDYVTKKIPEE